MRRQLLAARDLGPLSIGGLALALAALWLVERPTKEPAGSYWGQFLGAEAVLLLSIGLVLISTLPIVEQWFDGIDRAAIWHRRVAIAGLLLVVPHLALSSNPNGTALGGPLGIIGALGLAGLALWAIVPRWRSVVPGPLRGVVVAARDVPAIHRVREMLGGYERWRLLHRTAGLFVAAAFVHGALDGTPFDDAPALRWSYLAVGAIGVGIYVYRELLAQHFLSLHDYEVDEVRSLEQDVTEIALRPLGRPVDFVPGQFAMVYLEARDGWHRHPFTIASAPHEGVVRFTVKALGDYTSQIPELIQPGMPAVISGPHGRFSYLRGTDAQVWIAGGVGVAPFLSWLRALPDDFRHTVDFFYSADGPAPFADEIAAIAARHPSLRTHVIDSGTEARLTGERVLGAADCDPRELSVFMCGPQGMVSALQTQLRASGVAGRRIHREYFDWR
jgi:predicted ferric reductase